MYATGISALAVFVTSGLIAQAGAQGVFINSVGDGADGGCNGNCRLNYNYGGCNGYAQYGSPCSDAFGYNDNQRYDISGCNSGAYFCNTEANVNVAFVVGEGNEVYANPFPRNYPECDVSSDCGECDHQDTCGGPYMIGNADDYDDYGCDTFLELLVSANVNFDSCN